MKSFAHASLLHHVAAAILTGLLATSAMFAAPANERQAREWTRLLGSPEFIVRERATRELLALGPKALPILRETSESNDREVRYRSRRIMGLIEVRFRANRLAAFRAGRRLESEYGEMPGWRSFSRRFGDNDEARLLYANMLESEWALLSAAFGGDEARTVRPLLNQRLHELSRRGSRNYSLGSMLSVYILAAQVPDELDIHRQLYGLCLQHAKMRNALSPSSSRPLVRKIVGAWVVDVSEQPANANVCLLTAMRFQLPEGAAAAEKTLENQVEFASIKNLAMQCQAMFGDKSQAHLLEPYLTDTEKLHRTGTKQIRDVALACLFHMHGGDLEKIGVRRSSSTIQLFDAGSLGFENDAEREQAMQEWLALKAISEPQG